jgi:kynureninase
MTRSREQAVALDLADPLGPLREQFELPPGQLYLDGNSLGVLPRATAARVQQVVRGEEWGQDLIASWNRAGWMHLPQRVGDKIARLVGAGAGELVVADSTSVNLFKVLAAALSMARADRPARGGSSASAATSRPISTSPSRWPPSAASSSNWSTGIEDIPEASLDTGVAVLMLTQVNYRTGRMHDMARCQPAAHAAGALTVWDLAHSAGAVPVDLKAPTAPTSPSAAATSTSTAAPARRPSCGPPAPCRAVPAAAVRLDGPCGALRVQPGYRPAPASPATCAAPRRCCRWRRWSAASTPCWPPSRWAAWRRCVPSRWR